MEETFACKCNTCSGGIEFDAGDSGKTVQCPHCGLETILFYGVKPEPEPEPDKPPEKPKVAKATLLVRQLGSGGIENTLDNIGGVLAFLGFIGGLVGGFIGLSMVSGNNAIESAEGIWLLSVSVCIFVSSFVNKAVFNAFAEIVRLLKKSNGIPYCGAITEPEKEYVCSNCEWKYTRRVTECARCDAPFDDSP